MTQEEIKKELEKLWEIREAFYAYLDQNIPKLEGFDTFDFAKAKALDPKLVYTHFYKLDYQARKLRGIIKVLMEESR